MRIRCNRRQFRRACVAATVWLAACATRPPSSATNAPGVSPDLRQRAAELGGVPLLDSVAGSVAVRLVIEEWTRRRLPLEEYFLSTAPGAAPHQVALHVWHRDLLPSGAAVPRDGDPSGKSRTVWVDTLTQRIVRIGAWQ